MNDVPKDATGRETVGGRYVFHHLIWSTAVIDDNGEMPESQGLGLWPVHEVGRNADIFDPDAGRLIKAGSSIIYESTHLHSNGRDTKAKLRFGFKLHQRATSRNTAARCARSATGSTSTSSRTRPTSSCTPTSCSNGR